MAELTLEPISLGYSCDVKYHLSRSLYFRWYPDHTETQFRNMLFRWLDQPTRFRRHIFDWMIAPLPAVVAYLENDFRGVFERGDLELHDGARKIRHKTLLTIHPHDFRPGADGLYTEALIDAQYPAARDKFEYLAERFRRHLRKPGPYLYVFKQIRPVEEVCRLRDLLAARSPDHLFQLLLVDYRGEVNQVLNALRGQSVKGWLAGAECDKPPERRWEGNDAEWDVILGRFNLDLHPEGGQVQAGPAPWSIAPPPKRFDLDSPPSDDWQVLIDAQDPDSFLERFHYTDPLSPHSRPQRQGEAIVLESASPEAHFFCHMQPVAVLADGAWARVTLAWPPGTPPAERVAFILQDQDCRDPKLRTEVSPDGLVAWTRVSWDVDDLRLVFLPSGAARSVAPSLARIELHAPGAVAASGLKRTRRDEEYRAPVAPPASAPARLGLGQRLKRLLKLG